HRVYMHNVTIFGSTEASTCDASIECRAYGRDESIDDNVGATCNSVVGSTFRRVGFLSHLVQSIGKTCESGGKIPVCRPPNTPQKLCVMPWEHRLGSAGSRYSEVVWTAPTFGHFSGDDCGTPSVAFTINPTAIDMFHPNRFSNVSWLGTAADDARIDLADWSSCNADGTCDNRVGCDGACDTVLQSALLDMDGSLLGTGVEGSAVTSLNPDLATSSCEERPGHFACPDLKLRVLWWEARGRKSEGAGRNLSFNTAIPRPFPPALVGWPLVWLADLEPEIECASLRSNRC
ncbi:unnamed protein product, partial [Prorocentrum cordatum]